MPDEKPLPDDHLEILPTAHRLFATFWRQPPIRVSAVIFLVALLPALYAIFTSNLGDTRIFVDRTNAVATDPLTHAFPLKALAKPKSAAKDAAGKEAATPATAKSPRAEAQETLDKMPNTGRTKCAVVEIGKSGKRGDADAVEGIGLLCNDDFERVYRVKDVGYVSALNWSIVLTVLFPIAFYLSFRCIRSLALALQQMLKQKMLPDPDDYRRQADISDLTLIAWKRAFVIGLCTFVVGFGVIVWDYGEVVSKPYLHAAEITGDARFTAAETAPEAVKEVLFEPHKTRFKYEFDWSIAATFEQMYWINYPRLAVCLTGEGGEARKIDCNAPKAVRDLAATPGRDENFIFATGVYLILAFLTGLTLAFYGILLGFGWTIESIANDQVQARSGTRTRFGFLLLPNMNSQDPRRGFEVFGRFLYALMWATLVNYGMLYLMRTQNLFLRNHDYSNLTEFLFRDVTLPVASLFEKVKELGSDGGGNSGNLVGDILDLGPGSNLGTLVNVLDPGLHDSQAYLGIFVMLAVFAIVSIVFISATSDLAQQALDNLKYALQEKGHKDVADYYGLTENVLESRTDSMKTWPVSWPNLRNLLHFLGIGIVFLLFYRIWIIWLAALLLKFLRGGGLSEKSKE